MLSALTTTERRSGSVPNVVVLVVVVLLASNVANNLLLPPWAYVPWNMSVAAVVVMLALRVTDLTQLGFTQWKRGAVWGLTLTSGMVLILVVALIVPSLRELFDDERVDGGTSLMLYHVFVRIPFGTVGLEEVAFRAVLPGLLALRYGVLRACVVSSVLFGLWHVLPAWNLHESNGAVGGWFGQGMAGQVTTISFAAIGTFIAGLWWCFIRYRSGSVLATMIGHVSSNSLSYALAWYLIR